MNTFILQGCIKLIKSDIYNVIMLQKIQFQCCSFELSFHQAILTKEMYVSLKLLSSTTAFNIDNYQKCFCAAKQHIRMISEGSCDTEDWSNDAENAALITEINYILKYIIDRKQLF